MHDLVADIDRGAIDGERPFDGIDGPYHPGAEATGRTKHDSEVWFGWHQGYLGTESPLAGGQGTASSDKDLGLLLGSVKAL
jgi:hypothetical protein